jgi:hypothetical protein
MRNTAKKMAELDDYVTKIAAAQLVNEELLKRSRARRQRTALIGRAGSPGEASAQTAKSAGRRMGRPA